MKNTILFFIFISHISSAQISDFKTVDFTKADNIAKRYEGATLHNLPILVQNLTATLTSEVEKFRAIHTWVCNNINGDSYQHDTVARKRRRLQNDSLAFNNWNNEYKKIAFKKLLKYKETMCTGYAYLIKELCFLADIKCEIVDGYTRTADSNIDKLETPNHSWNAVYLNNKWYLCDATWSSGFIKTRNIFVKDYNDGYFLADPLLFAKSHYPLNKKWLLDDKLIEKKFVAGPLIYGDTFRHKIIPISPEFMAVETKKNSELHFKLKSLKTITNDKISLIQISGKNKKTLKIFDIKNENGLISFKHLFEHKGNYDIHVKINNDIVATYTINVSKF